MGVAETERRLGADHDPFTPHRFNCFPEHLLGAVCRGGIEQIDPELDGLPNDRDRVGLALALRQSKLAEPAATESGDADLQSGIAQHCVFHPSPVVCFRRLEVYIAHTAAPLDGGLSSDAKLRNVTDPHLAARRGDHTSMRIDQAVNIEDLHRMAKRRLPKIAFDFIEGGLEDERGLERNTSAFHKHQLLPRYLVDVSKRDQSATLFGRTYASPLGISPTGGAGLFRRGADLMLAEAAADANIPYIMSGSSNDSIEAAAKIAPKNAWYQLYAANDAKVREDMIRRTADAGLDALVLTVDVPVSSKRERNIRNGVANVRGGLFQALSVKPSILLESLTHPGWIVEYFKRGGVTPLLSHWAHFRAPRWG